MKNLKMSAIIISLVTFVSLVAFAILYFVVSGKIKDNMQKDALDNMETVLVARESVVEDYVEQGKNLLIAFSNASELTALLNDEENTEIYKAAMAYNQKYYGRLNGWEAVYLADWNTKVLTHVTEGPVGMILRKDADSLNGLRNSIQSNEVFVPGIMVSPASGQLMLSMYTKITDANGNIIGFVGGGTYAKVLGEKLNSVVASGMPGATGYMINVDTSTYIICDDEELLAQEIEDPMLLSIITRIGKGEESGSLSYTKGGVKYIAMYKYLPEYKWAMIISDKESEVYAAANDSLKTIAIIFVIAFLILLAVTVVVVILALKPLGSVTKSIRKLGDMNLAEDRLISGYVGKKSEIGQIASAVSTLRDTLREIVNTLSDCSDSLGDSASAMDKEAHGLIDNVTDNAAVSEELAASITSTNEAIDEAGRRVDDIRARVADITEKMDKCRQLSDNMTTSANKMQNQAADLLADSEQSIQDNKVSMNETVEGLKTLAQINVLADEILSITRQTNLLSLNASIEAARAGEAGRGFAVVAGEIGTLANNSSSTANNIQAICAQTNRNIEDTQKCFDSIIEYMENNVADAFKSFAQSAASYSEDVKVVQQNISDVSESAAALEDVLSVIIDQMNTVQAASQDNRGGVDEIVAKNESTTVTADNITSAVNVNIQNADKLQSIIKQFKM